MGGGIKGRILISMSIPFDVRPYTRYTSEKFWAMARINL